MEIGETQRSLLRMLRDAELVAGLGVSLESASSAWAWSGRSQTDLRDSIRILIQQSLIALHGPRGRIELTLTQGGYQACGGARPLPPGRVAASFRTPPMAPTPVPG